MCSEKEYDDETDCVRTHACAGIGIDGEASDNEDEGEDDRKMEARGDDDNLDVLEPRCALQAIVS